MASDVRSDPQKRSFHTVRPGCLSYDDGLSLQEDLLRQRSEIASDFLLLLEHLPVITLGRASSAKHLLASTEQLRNRGIALRQISRGGDITYHGPGQLVGYPIVYLDKEQRDLHRYLRKLERVLVQSIARFGIKAEILPGKTGVWFDGKKLASIGVAVRRWVTWHGFALNIEQQLEGFDTMIPCGLPGITMTSLQDCLGTSIRLSEVEPVIIQEFARVFTSTHLGDYVDTTA